MRVVLLSSYTSDGQINQGAGTAVNLQITFFSSCFLARCGNCVQGADPLWV